MNNSRGSRLTYLSTLGCLFALTVGSAFWLLRASDPLATTNEPALDPRLLILTDIGSTVTDFELHYVRFSIATAGGVNFGPPTGELPSQTRVLTLHFRAPRAGEIRYAIFLNKDAEIDDPQAEPRSSDVAVGAPGSLVESDCVGLSTLNTTQVITGRLQTDRTGDATVELFGGVKTEPRLARGATRQDIGVVTILPELPQIGPSFCRVTLPDWPYLADRVWSPPIFRQGVVSLGTPPRGVRIEAAVPTLDRTDELSWHTVGAASFSYSLVDENRDRTKSIYLFGAGVLASIGAALLVEIIRVTASDRKRSPPPSDDSASLTVDKPYHRVGAVILVGAAVLVARWLRNIRRR